VKKCGGSLRSKRFRRAFRPLEAFFAFWLRKNWGERQKSEKCIERAETLTETLATQASAAEDANEISETVRTAK